MRARITVRGLGVELRGRFDELTDEDAPTLADFAEAMKPFGLVIASPAEDDFDPFTVQGIPIDQVWGMQAQVIQGERALREAAEAELRDRELHHFETEEENTRLRVALGIGPANS
jgi:hypothetical protein